MTRSSRGCRGWSGRTSAGALNVSVSQTRRSWSPSSRRSETTGLRAIPVDGESAPRALHLEDAADLHGQPHIALQLELAGHEGHLAGELAPGHVDPVLRGHGEREIGIGSGAGVDRTSPVLDHGMPGAALVPAEDRKSTRLNSSHVAISYAVFCLKKK